MREGGTNFMDEAAEKINVWPFCWDTRIWSGLSHSEVICMCVCSCRSFSLCFLRESFHCLLTPALPLNYLIPFEFPFLCIWPIFPSRIFPLSLAVWKFTVVCLRMFLFSLIVLDTQGFFWLYLYFFPFIISLLISSLPFSLFSLCELLLVGYWDFNLLFSHSVMSDSLWHHGLQHTRLPCPSPTPRAYSNSYPLSQWRHPTI